MEKSSPRMTGGTRGAPVNSSPAVAANAEGEEIEVLESTDVLPVAPEDQWKSLFDKCRPSPRCPARAQLAPPVSLLHFK
ncbi:rhomboid-related protein 3 isoform X1 [Lates japonicus]|uniref:Rhomboid-related protein 3 isoform X1 n=1 Tax=Lates japonicus TaxID=270547 RepID=A0AAD3MZS4_LATJO|nr:rhomboid-related protein 3 isoform X1 [Lates japonicus]